MEFMVVEFGLMRFRSGYDMVHRSGHQVFLTVRDLRTSA